MFVCRQPFSTSHSRSTGSGFKAIKECTQWVHRVERSQVQATEYEGTAFRGRRLNGGRIQKPSIQAPPVAPEPSLPVLKHSSSNILRLRTGEKGCPILAFSLASTMALLRSYSVRSKRSRSAPEKDDIPALPYALDLSFDLDYGAPRPLFLAPPPSPSSPAPSIISTASKKSRWKAKLALLNPVRRFRKSSTEDDSILASPALSVRSSFDIPPHSPVESKSSSERTFSPMTPERFRVSTRSISG